MGDSAAGPGGNRELVEVDATAPAPDAEPALYLRSGLRYTVQVTRKTTVQIRLIGGADQAAPAPAQWLTLLPGADAAQPLQPEEAVEGTDRVIELRLPQAPPLHLLTRPIAGQPAVPLLHLQELPTTPLVAVRAAVGMAGAGGAFFPLEESHLTIPAPDGSAAPLKTDAEGRLHLPEPDAEETFFGRMRGQLFDLLRFSELFQPLERIGEEEEVAPAGPPVWLVVDEPYSLRAGESTDTAYEAIVERAPQGGGRLVLPTPPFQVGFTFSDAEQVDRVVFVAQPEGAGASGGGRCPAEGEGPAFQARFPDLTPGGRYRLSMEVHRSSPPEGEPATRTIPISVMQVSPAALLASEPGPEETP